MEITKGLQEDIVKIQNELITAIQNHQVLVLRQQVSPTENIKTQIEEVQRHIICLGESQKILVSRIRNEIELQDRTNLKLKTPAQQRPPIKSDSENERFNKRQKSQDLSRSLLIKNINKERSKKSHFIIDSDKVSERNSLNLSERQPSVDSSSEENRTPCHSPINGSSECLRLNVPDNERHGLKRTLSESHRSNTKRPKSTLQAAPRPTSPVPARPKDHDALSSSSEESLDSLLSQQPESESNKVDFALALGLITREVYGKVITKKSERRRRRVSNHHHLYNDLWDLTVLQKRTRVKEVQQEEADENGRDCETPQSDSDGNCFICQKPGELRDCMVCQTGCHITCTRNDICPACTNCICPSPTSPLKMEKKKELEQLKSNSKELHKSVSKLRERAKVLSASLVEMSGPTVLFSKFHQYHYLHTEWITLFIHRDILDVVFLKPLGCLNY